MIEEKLHGGRARAVAELGRFSISVFPRFPQNFIDSARDQPWMVSDEVFKGFNVTWLEPWLESITMMKKKLQRRTSLSTIDSTRGFFGIGASRRRASGKISS